ncbi:cysteine methyltransferase [Rhodococcus sp. SRB_17]|nr:cysteine methyltransferase [Rhodococcus sp. SRB_17]
MQFHPSTVQTRTPSPLGDIRLAASPLGLVGLWFDGQRHLPAQLDGPQAWPQDDQHPVLQAAVQQIHAYLRGERTQFDLPLDIAGGTPFQQTVWRALLGIARGQTLSYAALGAQIGCTTAVRAVGTAVGRNPLSVVVPCHRVLGKDGSLTGYAGGLERKSALLQLEGALHSAPEVHA